MPTKITISLPTYIVEDLKEIARVHNVTQSSVIASALYDKYKLLGSDRKPKEAPLKTAYKKAPSKSARRG